MRLLGGERKEWICSSVLLERSVKIDADEYCRPKDLWFALVVGLPIEPEAEVGAFFSFSITSNCVRRISFKYLIQSCAKWSILRY